MPKVKVKRTKPTLDMTPMVDLAFLLVTFFMLTTKFAPEEVLVVDTPSSVSEIKLPDSNVITVLVGNDNRVFFGVDGQRTKEQLLGKISEKYGVSFNEEETKTFSLIPNFGVPINQLKSYLAMDTESRKKVNQPGIPVDSARNELRDWILETRKLNSKVVIAIKGDSDVDYTTVQKVITTLQDQKVNRFNLITDMEARPKSL